uniref:Uncharacterized protein n=1 Tax=Glossina brevipalpis TaxID=37001 RepID=A0A1A9WHH8_9MUSC
MGDAVGRLNFIARSLEESIVSKKKKKRPESTSDFGEHQSQQNKVSPKLDFEDEDNETSNSTVPVIPGDGKKGKGDGNYNVKDDADEKETTTSKNSGKSGPKIHGVRVTVDTGDQTKESKESVEITDLSKHKKRVGIHTDITFEITAGDDDNKTSSEQDIDKEDASVPIFKGRDGSRHKPRKPYDPKSHWNPNFSTEHRVYEVAGQGAGGYSDYFPEYYPHNVPVYAGSSDARSGGESVYRQSDGWTSYIPRYWTTERIYRSNDVSNYRNYNWKPCYCATSGNEYRRRRHSHRHNNHRQTDFVVNPTSSIIEILDGKLERPFSKK